MASSRTTAWLSQTAKCRRETKFWEWLIFFATQCPPTISLASFSRPGLNWALWRGMRVTTARREADAAENRMNVRLVVTASARNYPVIVDASVSRNWNMCFIVYGSLWREKVMRTKRSFSWCWRKATMTLINFWCLDIFQIIPKMKRPMATKNVWRFSENDGIHVVQHTKNIRLASRIRIQAFSYFVDSEQNECGGQAA